MELIIWTILHGADFYSINNYIVELRLSVSPNEFRAALTASNDEFRLGKMGAPDHVYSQLLDSFHSHLSTCFVEACPGRNCFIHQFFHINSTEIIRCGK